MTWQYNPFSNQLEWVSDYSPPPQMGPQQPPAPTGQEQVGGALGNLAGLYGASKLPGLVGGTEAVAAAAPALSGATGATLAAAPTALGAASAPAAALPSLTASLAPSGAAGVGSAAAPAAGLSWGAIAAPVAAVAGPLLAGKFIHKAFFKDKPERAYNADEVAQDMPGEFNKLATQVKGYENLGTEQRKELLNALHDNKLLVLPGSARIENGEKVTADRAPEYINWSRYLRDPQTRHGGRDSYDHNDRWYSPVGKQPTEDEINKAYWLKDGKRQELLSALAAIKKAEGSGNA